MIFPNHCEFSCQTETLLQRRNEEENVWKEVSTLFSCKNTVKVIKREKVIEIRKFNDEFVQQYRIQVSVVETQFSNFIHHSLKNEKKKKQHYQMFRNLEERVK